VTVGPPTLQLVDDNEKDCIRSARSAANAVAFGYVHLARSETEHFGYNPFR
jgi:hypothetical protein